LLDLESLYALSIFMKLNGSSDIQYGFYTPKVNVDAPIFFGLNRTLSSFEDENFGSLLLIGTNLRFEASLLNTTLRRQQTRRALPYATVNSFAPQRLRQHHLGNSLKTLVGIAQGKSSLGLRMANSYNPSIILGFESLKGQNGFFITNLFRFIAKKFVAKTLSGERFGIIHSTVTSLNACYLGLTPGVRSSLHVESKGINKNIGMLFNLQTSDIPVPS
jgi:NADH-quinone oxidoreductase subunit G